MLTKNLLTALRAYRSPNVFNPWRDVDVDDLHTDAAAQRCVRLALHFDCEPKLLLVGEAPGYQGCHFSGVPFTNERLIVEGRVPRIQAPRFTNTSKPWSEPSATIVWGALHELGIAAEVVMWNAFAWHPHKPGDAYSNRAPTPAELLSGATVLRAVVALWPGVPVVAVGKVAERQLKRLGVHVAAAVQHPAYGGAPHFRAGLAEFVRTLSCA